MSSDKNISEMPNICKYFSQFKPIHFKRGEIIQRPNLLNPSVFYIETGCIKKYTVTEDGEEKISMIYQEDDIFPISNLIQDLSKDFFSEALTETSIRQTEKTDFWKYLKENPKAMAELMEYLFKHINTCYRRIENLGFIASHPRVIFILLSLAEKFGKLNNNGLAFEIPMRQKDIANTIAMTRETVGRELEKLTKEGIISCQSKSLIINDVNKLIKKMDSYEEIKWRIN